jgi:hypothetical protein
MYPTYDKTTGLFVIEWYERKEKKASPIRHYFEQKPIKIQLHPADPKVIIRVHLSGKMPGWIKDYCEKKEHRFEFEEVRFGEEIGWLLTNWYNHKAEHMPIIAPNLQGALRKLAEKIPGVCPELKQQLLENVEVASRNLKNYNDIFENIGVYYRPEEISGEEGCLVVDHSCFLIKPNEVSDEDYRAKLEGDGRLFTIVRELTNPLPEPASEESLPLGAEEDKDIPTYKDEPLGDLEPEDELLGDLESEDELLGDLESEDELLGDLESEDELLGDLESEDELLGDLEPEDELLGDLEPEDEPLGDPEPVGVDANDNAEVLNTSSSLASEVEPKSSAEQTKGPIQPEQEESAPFQFVILDYNDKKAGVLEGQMSIF